MANLNKILVVDDDLYGRFLISKTLVCHFPDAVVEECEELEKAVEFVRELPGRDHHAVVIAHQISQAAGIQVVAALRATHASVPIIWTGDSGQAHRALRAGATRFLEKQSWLMIGQTVEEVI